MTCICTYNTTQVQRGGVTISSIPVDDPQGQLTISDLDPDTRYTFTILAANELGENMLVDTGNTTLGIFLLSYRYTLMHDMNVLL